MDTNFTLPNGVAIPQIPANFDPNSPIARAFRTLQRIRIFMHNEAVMFTEDEASWAPGASMLSVCEQILHAGDAVTYLMKGAFTEAEFDQVNFDVDNPDAHRVKTIKEALAEFDQSIDVAMKLVGANKNSLFDTLKPNFLFPGFYTKLDVLEIIADHTAAHRGALTQYARMMGKNPPFPYFNLSGGGKVEFARAVAYEDTVKQMSAK